MTPKKGYSKKKKVSSGYSLFLKSKYWKKVRKTVLTRDGFMCRKCGYKKKLQVHHLSYEHHNYEHLHLDDLITLCKKCHESLHNIKNNTKKSINK